MAVKIYSLNSCPVSSVTLFHHSLNPSLFALQLSPVGDIEDRIPINDVAYSVPSD